MGGSKLEVRAKRDLVRGERRMRRPLQGYVVEIRRSVIGVHILAKNFPVLPDMVGEAAADRPTVFGEAGLFRIRGGISGHTADRAVGLVVRDRLVGPGP